MLLCLTSLIFSSVPAPAVGAPELKAELVNKTWEGWSGASPPTARCRSPFPNSHTKLLPYHSHLQPVVADGKVYIFTTKNLGASRIVVYGPGRGRGQSFPLPEDLGGSPSFSPDGTKVAYYSHQEAEHVPHWSFIDRTGKTVPVPPVPRQFKGRPSWGEFSEGLAQVSEPRSVGVRQWGKMGYEDETGKVVIQLQCDSAGYFSEGLEPVEIGEKWGFINRTGETVIPLQYALAHSFSEGLAWVAVDGKIGFIDQTGKMVISPQYDEAEDFHQGVAKVGIGVMEWTSGGGRVRSWPDWQLLWQSSLCTPTCSDAPPLQPIWETNSLAFFDPEFCSRPRFLKYQVPEPGKSDEARGGKT